MVASCVLLAIWNPWTVCKLGILMFINWVLLLINKSPVMRVRLLACTSANVFDVNPKDPVTLASALMERFPTC